MKNLFIPFRFAIRQIPDTVSLNGAEWLLTRSTSRTLRGMIRTGSESELLRMRVCDPTTSVPARRRARPRREVWWPRATSADVLGGDGYDRSQVRTACGARCPWRHRPLPLLLLPLTARQRPIIRWYVSYIHWNKFKQCSGSLHWTYLFTNTRQNECNTVYRAIQISEYGHQ